MDNSYEVPKIWKDDESLEGKFGKINRSTSGARTKSTLPSGEHEFQLYSLATPNGIKVTILFEELIELGIKEAEYDAYPVNILEGDQFGSGFVDINPNSKIPALLHKGKRVFESGSILLYLAEHFNKFIPENRTEMMNWLFWQMGSAPYVGGGFGHFYQYAPTKIKYCIDRFTMEAKRQLDVLDQHLEGKEFMVDEYSIADIAIFPWYGGLVLNQLYNAAEFLDAKSYKNVLRWAQNISQRPAVQRGLLVNKAWGENQMPERHSMEDFKNV